MGGLVALLAVLAILGIFGRRLSNTSFDEERERVVMTAPDEEGLIGLHSRRDIMLHPACPENVPFVRSVLDSFFDMKQEVRKRYQQLTMDQSEEQKKRRPVGFATDIPENS